MGGSMDKFANKFPDNLIDRAQMGWSAQNPNLDDATLGKQGRLALGNQKPMASLTPGLVASSPAYLPGFRQPRDVVTFAKTKSQKVHERRAQENKLYKKKMTMARKSLEFLVADGKDGEAIAEAYNKFQSAYDKAPKKRINVIHQNKAARKKAQAAK